MAAITTTTTASTPGHNDAASGKHSIQHVDAIDNVSNQPSDKEGSGTRDVATDRPAILDGSPEDLRLFEKKMLWKVSRLRLVLCTCHLFEGCTKH
jgi:hypothetical protein